MKRILESKFWQESLKEFQEKSLKNIRGIIERILEGVFNKVLVKNQEKHEISFKVISGCISEGIPVIILGRA